MRICTKSNRGLAVQLLLGDVAVVTAVVGDAAANAAGAAGDAVAGDARPEAEEGGEAGEAREAAGVIYAQRPAEDDVHFAGGGCGGGVLVVGVGVWSLVGGVWSGGLC